MFCFLLNLCVSFIYLFFIRVKAMTSLFKPYLNKYEGIFLSTVTIKFSCPSCTNPSGEIVQIRMYMYKL